MGSKFSAARRHLEEAHRMLRDDDELSVKSRQALAILIDALLSAEYAERKQGCNVIAFPGATHARHKRS